MIRCTIGVGYPQVGPGGIDRPNFGRMLTAMTSFTDLVDTLAGAVDALAEFDDQYAIRAGLDPRQVSAWAGVREVYFGATSYTRKQARALQLARRFSLHQLVLIERRLKRLPVNERWAPRLELLQVGGNYCALEQAARDLLPDDSRTPEDGVRFSKSKNGKRKFSGSGDEHVLAALEQRLRDGLDTSRPAGPQLFSRLTKIIEGDAGVQVPVPRPIVAVAAEQHVAILADSGDDVLLGLTDGTTITGAEYVAALMGEIFPSEVALVHPEEGPVNLYRTQRVANSKQRDLARIATPMCPVPGCRVSADLCEFHHTQAWSQGGETNLANLVPLCRYHNRVNHDDPRHTNRRGRIERIRGRHVWVSPRGHPVANTVHPYGVMELLFGACPSGAASRSSSPSCTAGRQSARR